MKFFTIAFLLILFPRILNSAPNIDSTKADSTDELSNYPNPFNPSTVITFRITSESKVSLKVYNILGQIIENLIDKRLNAGEHKVTFNAQEVPGGLMSGVYLYRLEAWGDDGSTFSAIRKMILTK